MIQSGGFLGRLIGPLLKTELPLIKNIIKPSAKSVLARRGKLYDIVARGILLHASECWPLRREEIQRLLHNERAMVRWMLKVKIEDNVSLSTMCAKLNLASLQSKLRLNRLRWYGHVVRSENWINSCFHLEVDGFKGKGRPRKTGIETINEDLKEWNIDSNLIKD